MNMTVAGKYIVPHNATYCGPAAVKVSAMHLAYWSGARAPNERCELSDSQSIPRLYYGNPGKVGNRRDREPATNMAGPKDELSSSVSRAIDFPASGTITMTGIPAE